MKLSIRLKLVGFTFCVVLLVGGAIAVYAIYQGRQRILTTFDKEAREITTLIGGTVANDLYLLNVRSLKRRLESARVNRDIRYTYVTDVDGVVLADGTEANALRDQKVTDGFSQEVLRVSTWISKVDGGLLKVGGPLFMPDGRRIGYLQVGYSLDRAHQIVRETTTASLYLTALCLGVGVILAALVAASFSRPILALVKASEAIAAGRRSVRVPVESKDEIGRLASAFNEMAVSLEDNEAALHRKVVETGTLYEIGQEITAQVALEPTLRLIVERARGLLQADIAYLALPDSEAGSFVVQAHSGTAPGLVAGVRFGPGKGVGGHVVVTGTPMLVDDDLEDDVDSPFLGVVREAGIRSYVVVPLKAHARVIGVLFVGSGTPHKFREDDQQLLSALADQASVAIENAKLYQQVRKYAEELEQKVELRTSELQEANRRLETASRHKSQFLANMSHELRTPLNAILGYTELMLDGIYGHLPARGTEVLERVLASGRHLLGLINDVLDLSKIEAGRLTLALADYSMKEVVHTAYTAVEPLAAEKKLALEVRLSDDLPAGRGDERRLTQVLLNLLGNAIKFCEAGTIAVQAHADDGAFLVAVSDTGPGIAESDQQKIFEEFEQADASDTRKKKGTGLGLAIARKIIALHGGRIWVESKLGEGSTFWLTIPIRVERQAEATWRDASS